MDEFLQIVSKLNFTSFCSNIAQQGELSVFFKLKHSYHGNRIEEVFCIKEADGVVMISDIGRTLANLDNIFELKEPDVRKNIMAILKQFRIEPDEGNALTCRIDLTKDMMPQIIRYLQGIHFLYGMKLFYF